MKELRDIVNAYKQASATGKKMVLATVVHLDGSSYRRPGARMLIDEDGRMIGAISGGCLEGDALQKAMFTLTEQRSRLVTYDTSDEDDMSIGVQLGCEGIIQVLFEYIDIDKINNPITLLQKAISSTLETAVVTLFTPNKKHQAQIGTSLLIDIKGKVIGEILLPELKSYLVKDAQTAIIQKQSMFKEYRTEKTCVTVFIEYVQKPISLCIVGAGNDAIPLMQIANTLGWDVKIIDGRSTHAKTERFASACQIVVDKPAAAIANIVIDERTCFVLMTHNYQYDLQLLKAILTTKVKYIGILGPKKKFDKMLDDLNKDGIEMTNEMMSRIYGPTGLDINAETPEEIALSIIAEIQAVFNNKAGGILRAKHEAIHSRDHLQIQVQYISA